MTKTQQIRRRISVPDNLKAPKPAPPSQLARLVLDLFGERPQLHDQETWFVGLAQEEAGHDSYEIADNIDCGTRMCAAGAVCMMAGYRLIVEDGAPYAVDPARPDEMMRIPKLGKRLLKLKDTEADELFWRSTNEQALDELRWIASHPEFDDRW